MGQQTNKIQKRRRRLDYLARVKAKAKAPRGDQAGEEKGGAKEGCGSRSRGVSRRGPRVADQAGIRAGLPCAT